MNNSINELPILTRRKIANLLVTQALVVAPILMHLPIWIGALWLAVVSWRWLCLINFFPAPARNLIHIITIGCVIGLYLNFAGRVGMDAALGLLTCTFVLKILEMQSLRDAQLIIFIGFIVTSTQLLLSQTIPAAFYALLSCAFLVGSWRGIYLNREKPIIQSLKRNASVALQSIPIMLIIFIILPRIAPLWTMPDENTPKTGFSEDLSPGDLSQLVRNHEAAFRVSFTDEKPAASELYWRGLVLNAFDGRTWSHAKETNQAKIEKNYSSSSKKTNYQVILEPHGHRWLFSLGQVINVKSDQISFNVTNENLIKSQEIIRQRLDYQVTSQLFDDRRPEFSTKDENLSEDDLNFYTKLPKLGNPQTRAMVSEWLRQGLSPQNIITEMQKKIASEFSYTLQPPGLGNNPIDDFLFLTKRGFCEHFASSFAYVMRSANIPARVVVGYQGGIWNEIENYLLVSQADAHAWVEVWINNHWQRIDPTAAVAPNRIETGIDDALTQNDQALLSRRWQQSPWLWAIQKRWDAAGYAWQKFVLNYDNKNRESFIETLLGSSDPWKLGLNLIAIIFVTTIFVTGYNWLTKRNRSLSTQDKLVRVLEKKLKIKGYYRNSNESLSRFCQRVAIHEPALSRQLNLISKQAETSLYATSTFDPRELKRLIYQLKVS